MQKLQPSQSKAECFLSFDKRIDKISFLAFIAPSVFNKKLRQTLIG